MHVKWHHDGSFCQNARHPAKGMLLLFVLRFLWLTAV